MRMVMTSLLGAVAAAAAGPAALAAGGTLTIPQQVRTVPGSAPVVTAEFSYAVTTPSCTGRVSFTWDGATWLSELPVHRGSSCVATVPRARPPEGKATPGAHTVCASAGAQAQACGTVMVVAGSGAVQPAAGATTAPNPTTGSDAAQPAAATAPSGFILAARSTLAPRLAPVAWGLAALLVLAAAGVAAWWALRGRGPRRRGIPTR